MRHVVKTAVSLLKLRIGVAVAASGLAGMAAANGPPLTPAQILGVTLAILGASGAAGAFNHYYERDLDRLMRRTRSRPFASGALTASAWWPAGFLAFLCTSVTLGWAAGGSVSAFFVFLGAFTYGVVYTVWLKRRTSWNIVVGGLAGSFAVLAGAAAVDPNPQAVPIILAIVLFLWTPPHFWSLAAAKRDDYANAGVPMLPVCVPDRAWTMAVLAHAVVLAALSLLPVAFGMGLAYAVPAAVGGALLVARSIALYRSPSRQTAMANFFASLAQLTLLVAGVLLDAMIGS